MGKRVTLNEKRLNKKHVEALIEQGAVFDQDKTDTLQQSSSFDMPDIHKLSDGHYLFVSKEFQKGTGHIWPKEYVEKWMLKLKRNNQQPQVSRLSNFEHWYYFSKVKESFPGKIQLLVSGLFETLELPAAYADFSYNSLDVISRKFEERGEDVVENELYDGIVAYLGEILRRKVGGEWEFYPDSPNFFRPLISIGSTWWLKYDPVTPIWLALVGDVTGFNLRRNLISEIRRNQLTRNLLYPKKTTGN